MRRLARFALSALAFSPLLACAVLVAHYAVDVPIGDDLARATLLQHWQQGTLDWQDLYSPHLGHRIVIPRLITLLSASLAGGSLIFEQWVIFALVAVTAVLVHVLVRKTFPGRPGTVYGLTFLANVLLFSPLQWETFLFASHTSLALPPLCLCAALVALRSGRGPALKFALCFTAALLATWSFSSGMMLWPVVFAVVLLQRSVRGPRVRAAFLAAWLAASAAVLVPHFMLDDVGSSADPASVESGDPAPDLQLGSLPARAVRAVRFGGAVIGSPLARTTVLDPRDVAPWAALALAVGFALPAVWAILAFALRRDAALRDRWLPWLAVGGWAATTAVLLAIGRSALDPWSYGLAPRYLSVSTYLLLADAVLLTLLVEEVRRSLAGRRPDIDTALRGAPALAAGVLLGLQGLQWGIGVAGMREWQSARLQARISMLFLEQFGPTYSRRISGLPASARERIEQLDEAGYLKPPLLRDARLAHFAIDETALPAHDARLQHAIAYPRDLAVDGFAWLPEARRRADGVLITAREESGERVVVGLAELHGVPVIYFPEADHLFNQVGRPGLEEFASFRGRVDLARLPLGDAVELEAWAVDARRMRVQRFAQRIVLRATPDGPKAVLDRADEAR